MINCKKHIIAACFSLSLPLMGWAEAPVVDDSDNFAMMDEQQGYEAPVANPKYDEPVIDNADQDVGPALVKEEIPADNRNQFNNNASLIDKVASLQKEVQELRGQLEVQAHDLKVLQQQQTAFYKDLDARLGSANHSSAQAKPTTNLDIGATSPTPQAVTPTAPVPVAKTAVVTTPVAVNPASRINPADEQISYLAAYELVKNKRYDDATVAMHNFVQKYPKGGYSANAEYWLGELYLVKKDYTKAIEHFDIVLKQYPSSSKSAASLLKSGYAFSASGNSAEAKSRFQQVVRNYPGTPTAKLASTKLESL